MATNFVQEGKVLVLTAPSGGVTAGTPLFVDGMFVVPQTTAAQAALYDAYVEGVVSLTKTASQGWAKGQPIYWDVAAAKADSRPSQGPFIGFSSETIGSGVGDTTGYVKLVQGTGANVYNVRVRATAAEIKAKKVIVPAIAGRKLRLIDAAAMAYGGAVAAVTTVDILGTLSTERKLCAFAQASLTQSTLVRMGSPTEANAAGTGCAILADGASYTANDAGAAITAGLTGSDITTATGVDFIVTYAIEY